MLFSLLICATVRMPFHVVRLSTGSSRLVTGAKNFGTSTLKMKKNVAKHLYGTDINFNFSTDCDSKILHHIAGMPNCRYLKSRRYWSKSCGSGTFVPDPNFFHPVDPGSRVRKNFEFASKNLSILTHSKLSEIWSGMFIPNLDLNFLLIPDPGYQIQRYKRHRIPDTDPQHWNQHLLTNTIPGTGRAHTTPYLFFTF